MDKFRYDADAVTALRAATSEHSVETAALVRAIKAACWTGQDGFLSTIAALAAEGLEAVGLD